MSKDIKGLFKQDTEEIKGNFKLAVVADDYINNPTEENFNNFKEEIEKSSSLSMASELSYLGKKVIKEEDETKKEAYNLLIETIKSKFTPGEERVGVYDPMLGEIVYPDEENKKMNM